MSPPKRAVETTEALRISLIEHARQLIAREGPAGLTMRALAIEAGCATGLPYKVFADRHELVLELVHAELVRLASAADELVERAGSGTVAGNLSSFAELLLDSPAAALAKEVASDGAMSKSFTVTAHGTGRVLVCSSRGSPAIWPPSSRPVGLIGRLTPMRWLFSSLELSTT